MRNILKALIFIGFGLGIVASLFIGGFMVGEGLPDLYDGKMGDLWPMIPLTTISIAGVAYSFFKRSTGALVSIGSSLLLGGFLIYKHTEIWIIATYTLSFIIPALLVITGEYFIKKNY
jgi:lipoprotein signal peptidase